MSLFGALSELVCGAALAAAPACDLALPDGAIEDQAGFVAWMAEREEMRDVRLVVEAIGREIWVGAETRGLAQRDLDHHIRSAGRMVAHVRPSAALIAEVAAAARSGKSAASHSGETIAWRIASDMVSRARTAGAFAGGIGFVQSDIPLREDVVQFLLDRTFAHLLGDDRRLLRLGPALADFADQGASGADKVLAPGGVGGLGISRMFASQIEQAGGATFLASLAERFGLSERSVQRLVALVDGQAVGAEGRIARLQSAAQWLSDVRTQLLRPTNEDPETRRLKAAAAAALGDGDFETAMDALRVVRRELRETRRRTEERLQDEALALRNQMVEEARATARLAELFSARGEHAQAAELFTEAAVALPRADLDTAWRYNLQKADALLQHARERADGNALAESLAVYGTLVRQAAEGTDTKVLAEACLGHGEALLTAGERDPGSSRLKDSIAIFQKAIQLLERERDIVGLIRARISLAKAMARQGERDGSVETLRQAAQAFRDAASAIAADKLPADTVSIQLSLGNVLLAIEERAGGVELLSEAADAYRAALAMMDSEIDSDRWGEAQMNLGLALLGLGEQSGSTQQLEESTQAFRAAIEVTPRVTAPRRWALTQMNLGNALAALGDRDSKGTTLLDEAIDVYNLALEELLREAEPLKWAITQMNLGTALIRLGERVDRRRHWLAAAGALVPALEVFEQQGANELAEMTRRNLRRFQENWDSIIAPPVQGAAAAAGAADANPAQNARPRLAQIS
jgi:tetratricopeptide (TPR) repeat protein